MSELYGCACLLPAAEQSIKNLLAFPRDGSGVKYGVSCVYDLYSPCVSTLPFCRCSANSVLIVPSCNSCLHRMGRPRKSWPGTRQDQEPPTQYDSYLPSQPETTDHYSSSSNTGGADEGPNAPAAALPDGSLVPSNTDSCPSSADFLVPLQIPHLEQDLIQPFFDANQFLPSTFDLAWPSPDNLRDPARPSTSVTEQSQTSLQFGSSAPPHLENPAPLALPPNLNMELAGAYSCTQPEPPRALQPVCSTMTLSGGSAMSFEDWCATQSQMLPATGHCFPIFPQACWTPEEQSLFTSFTTSSYPLLPHLPPDLTRCLDKLASTELTWDLPNVLSGEHLASVANVGALQRLGAEL